MKRPTSFSSEMPGGPGSGTLTSILSFSSPIIIEKVSVADLGGGGRGLSLPWSCENKS